MNSKMAALTFVSKVNKILKTTQEKVKELTKDKSLNAPIEYDIILSEKAYAYDQIITAFKEYREQKNKNNAEN